MGITGDYDKWPSRSEVQSIQTRRTVVEINRIVVDMIDTSLYGLHKVVVLDGAKTRNKLEPDPEDSVSARVVRRIFNMAVNDAGCKEIAKTLNQDGFRTINGERWGKVTVHKVLTNEAYCGTLVWGGRAGHPALSSGGAAGKSGKRLASYY